MHSVDCDHFSGKISDLQAVLQMFLKADFMDGPAFVIKSYFVPGFFESSENVESNKSSGSS